MAYHAYGRAERRTFVECQCGSFAGAVVNLTRTNDETCHRRESHDVTLPSFQHPQKEFFDQDKMGSNIDLEDCFRLLCIRGEKCSIGRCSWSAHMILSICHAHKEVKLTYASIID